MFTSLHYCKPGANSGGEWKGMDMFKLDKAVGLLAEWLNMSQEPIINRSTSSERK